jgi:peptidoglycan-associated lipoprotein
MIRILACASPVLLFALAACHDPRIDAPVADATAEPPPQSGVLSSIHSFDRIFFAYDSASISAEAQDPLERFAAFAHGNPDMTFTIEGHCDERGTREYNLALGQRRADATRDALVALGVDPARLRVISYGKERPAYVGKNEALWAQNRRAVFVVNN